MMDSEKLGMIYNENEWQNFKLTNLEKNIKLFIEFY